MPFKEQWTLSSKCYATSFNYSACFSPRHVFPGDIHAIFWVLEHTGHPCLHLHHHCRFQAVSVISSPPWLPSPGSRLHFPVQSLLVAWGKLDTLTVAIYERKVIPCSKSLYVGWLGGFRLCHVVADFLLKQCLIPFWMHEPGHFSNTSEHVDTINFPESTTRQTDKLSVQSKKYRLWTDWRRLGTHGWNR